MTTTIDGKHWTALQRIPLDAIGSGVEHITAGIAVDSTTSGSGAHLAVTYFYWANAGHSCQVFVGQASSLNGGATWSQSRTLAGPTVPNWWAHTEFGFMTGDYISTSISANRAVSVAPVAQSAPTGTTFHQAMYAASLPLAIGTNTGEVLSTSALSPKDVPAAKGSGKDYHTGS